MFSLELLQAISDWQRGGNASQKARRGIALKEAAKDLPETFKKISSNCYRQIAMDNSSVWNIGTKYQLSETISSWTTSLEVAKQFKGGVPPKGYQGVIFKISPIDELEVIVNLQELFECNEFKDAIEEHKDKICGFHSGIGKYGNSQLEAVISTEYLKLETLFAWGGYTSPESELAEIYFGHIASEDELRIFRDLMNQAGHKCGAYWLTTADAVQRVSEKLKVHGERLSEIKKKQENA
ncbi:MAG: hypothetical protein Q7T35_01340 [Nitrosomonas sp.]|nr:hypothetical protein [Nitrosomonas sp.]